MKKLSIALLLICFGALLFGINAEENAENALAEKFKHSLGINNLFISLDKDQNVLVTGFFSDSIHIGGKCIQSMGVLDIFIAKYDPSHQLIWVRHAGGSNIDFSRFINTDKYDNIYIQGLYRGEAFFQGYHLDSKGTYDFFTAKYGNDGKLLYVKTRKENSIVKSPNDTDKGWFWSWRN